MSDYVDVMAMLIGSRYVEPKHLGLGDIRLTPDEQDRIVDYVHRLEARINSLKSDDHIAEVNRIQDIQVKQAEAMWKVNAENEKLQARIDELEEEFRCLDDNYVSPKQIKAEGIRDMVGLSDCAMTASEILRYAEELWKGNE